MELVRYVGRGSEAPLAGVLDAASGTIAPLRVGLAELLRLEVAAIRERVEEAIARAPREDRDTVDLLVPIEGRMELWAAGVTYERSRDERMKESEGSASIYDLVYDADRPELFLKAVPWRVVGHGGPIGIRVDSAIDVPEAELAVVVSAAGEIVGYTVCDDVSSRSIEGENPLYLPQAKVYEGSAALASTIRPAWEVADPYALEITLRIERGAETVYEAAASTAQLHRKLHDLAAWCRRALPFPDGFVLSTGTSLVPPLPFTLVAGDVVAIAISEVGELVNPVVDVDAG